MSKAKDLIDYTVDPEGVAGEVINQLLDNASTVVNGKNKKAKFDKKTGAVSGLENAVEIAETNGVYYALGTADVKAYYFNEKLFDANFTVASSVAAGVFNNYGQAVDSMTFARGAATTKIYAYGKDVTLLDTTAGDIYAAGFNKYNKKNADAKIEEVAGDVEINVINSTAKNIYAGGEGDGVYQGDVVINVYNSKVGKIYAGGKTGSYTEGDVTVVVSNNGNKNANGTNMVFSGAVFGAAADKNSMSWGTTNVVINDYKGAYKGAFNYVDTVLVSGDSDVTLNGAMKEVGTIAVAGGASATVNKAGAYAYELILTADSLTNSASAMLTVGKAVKAIDKVVVTVADDYAMNGAVNLISWAGYTPAKGAAAVVPNFSVMNGNGGIVADYMYDYSFDANNNLVFEYTGEAFTLMANIKKTFGAADDKVVVLNNYNYTLYTTDLGAGTNEIDITNANGATYGAFELKVSKASANTVDARGFADDVSFLDNGKGANTAIVDAAQDVDFKNSKEATLVVDGAYTGNVDFSSVSGDATVVLENGAQMNIGQIDAGVNDVVIEVGAFNEVTINDLDVEEYILQKDNNNFVDVDVNLGNNAVINTAAGKVVQNYSKNVRANANETFNVLGNMSSDVLVNGAATVTLNNYGKVSGDIAVETATANVELNNYGEFTGSLDFGAFNSDQTITNKSKPNTDLGAAKLGGTIALGGGTDKLVFDGDTEVSADITKYNGTKLDIEVKNGTTEFSGNISYTMDGIYDDERIAADEAATANGIANTDLTITDATLNIAEGSKLDVNKVTIGNAVVNGEFDAQTVAVNKGTVVFEKDETFRGDLAVEGANTVLNAQNVTVEGNVDVEGTMNAKVVDAQGGIDVTGTLNADVVKGADIVVKGTVDAKDAVTATDDILVVSGKLTAGGDITAADNIVLYDDVEVSAKAIAAEGDVTSNASAKLTAASLSAQSINLNGKTDVAGNVTATDDVTLNGVTTVGGKVASAAGQVSITANVEAGDIEAATNAVIDTTGAATAVTVGKVNADVITLTAGEAGDVVTAGDLTATANYDEDGNYVDGGNIALAGAGKVVAGAVNAEKAFTNTAAELELNGKVTAESFAITDGQVVTFGKGADIDTIAASGAATLILGDTLTGEQINVADAAALTVKADEKVAVEADANLNTNAALTLENIDFNGTVTEVTNGATVTLKDATVDEIVFNGSTVNVENAGTVDKLTFNTAMTINGVISAENDVVDVLTIGSGIKIADDEAVTKTLNINTATVVGDIDLVNELASGNVNTFGTVTLNNVEATVNANGYAETDTLTMDSVKGNVTGTGLGKVVVKGTAEGWVNASTSDIEIGNWKSETAVVSGKNVAIKAQEDAVQGTLFATGDLTVDAADAAYDVDAAATVGGNMTLNGANNVAIDATVGGNATVNAAAVTGQILATGDAVVNGAVDAFVRGANVTVAGATVAGNLQALKGTVNVSGAEVVDANLRANKGSIVVTGATEIKGAMYVTNSTIEIGEAVVSGDVTAIATDYQDYVYDLTFVDGYTGAITAEATAGSVTFNFVADEFYAVSQLGNVTVNYTVNNTYVDYDDVTGYIDAATALPSDVNADIKGEYIGDITSGDVKVQGNYFGSYDGTLNKGTVNVNDFTVAGEASAVTQGAVDAYFAAKKDAENQTHKSTLAAWDEVAGKYVGGLVYADITATGDVEVDKLFVGTVDAANVTFKKDATADFDTVTEVAPGAGMDAAVATAPVNKVLVTGGNVVAEGSVYGNVDYYVNEEFVEGDLAREKVAVTNGADITANDVDIKGDFYGTISATGDVVLGGDIVGGKVEVFGNSEIIDYPTTDYTATTISAGTFENTNADALIKADITTNGVDFTDPETGDFVKASLVTVAKVDGNVTANSGSVDVKDVTGDVYADQNAVVNGTVGGDVQTYNGSVNVNGVVEGDVYANIDAVIVGEVKGNVDTYVGDADITGNVGGYVDAVGNVTVKGETVGKYVIAWEGDVDVEANVDEYVYAELGAAKVIGNVKQYVDAAKDVYVEGNVGDYVYSDSGNIEVIGEVTNDVEAYAGSAKVTGNVGTDVTVEVNAEVYGNVGGSVFAHTGDATVTGTVGGSVDAAKTATISGDVTYDVTATAVKKGENATIATVGGVVTANSIELADVAVGGVVAGDYYTYGAENVVVDNVNGNIEFYASKDAALTAADVNGSSITISNGQNPANLAPSIVINATFGKVDVDNIGLNGLTYLYENGEEGPRTVTSEINFTADQIVADTINIEYGNVVITAEKIGKEFVADNSVVGIIIDSAATEASLTLNADVYAQQISGDYLDLTVNKLVSGAIDAVGNITMNATVEVNTLTVGAEAAFAGALITATDITVAERAADADPVFGAASTVTADTLKFEAETVEVSKYFSADSSFKVDTIDADTLIVDQALTLTAAVKVTGDLTVNADVTGAVVTMSKDGAVFDGSASVANGIEFASNGTVAQIFNTAVSGNDDANAITFEAKAGDDVKMTVAAITLNGGDDALYINSALTAGDINGGAGNDALYINGALTAGSITEVESFIFGENGSLAATWEITADTEVTFAKTGVGESVISGVTVSGLTTDDFITVGDEQWMWNGTDAFVAADGLSHVEYDDVKKELSWHITA